MNISPDCGLRISLDELLSISLRHVVSGLDETSELNISDCGRQTRMTGYTEWVSSTTPTLTVGWDCHLDATRSPYWVRSGLPRTNMVLVSDLDQEYKYPIGLHVLASMIDAMDWQEVTNQWITNRYRSNYQNW